MEDENTHVGELLYVVMTLHRDVEISGLAGVRTVPLTYLDGMVGVMPVFASRSEAEKFADGAYSVMEIATTPKADLPGAASDEAKHG